MPISAASVLLGLMIHTFFDGIAITSRLPHFRRGWVGSSLLAVFLHKIPEGFTVTSVMLASGLSKGKSWFASVMLGVATIAGVLTMAVGQHAVRYGLPVAAGVTIYVAASDLIPEVNREPGVKMALVVFVGVAALFVSRPAGTSLKPAAGTAIPICIVRLAENFKKCTARASEARSPSLFRTFTDVLKARAFYFRTT